MSVDDSMRRTLAEQHDEIGTLKAENAKLRGDLEFERSENGWAREFLNRIGPKCGTKDCPSLVAYVTKLEDENAKLRELVAELYECSRQCGCDHCGYKDGCSMFDRMAQLGIEVE